MPRLTCLVLTLSLVGYGGFSGSGWGDSTAGWEEDGGSPATFGDDDDASNDDDATDDDDDAAGDDDDATDDDDDATDDDDTTDGGLYEGDEPGECTDGADNDLDGWFDCEDVGCFGSPDCEGEAGGDDDDATDDDDDATDDDTTPPPGDDDDDTPAPGAPAITSVTSNWNGSTGEFEFTIYMSDGDCDLGLPTIYWSVDGVEQSPATLTGGSLSCSGQVDFFIGGLTATYSYTFGFWIDDSAGNLSAPYTLTVTAA
ncbi:MAG: hypothetical protein GY898_25160 [Proteobacteria bacterium]|nr:hypothetical protein [Pseudomonadota bacterium]